MEERILQVRDFVKHSGGSVFLVGVGGHLRGRAKRWDLPVTEAPQEAAVLVVDGLDESARQNVRRLIEDHPPLVVDAAGLLATDGGQSGLVPSIEPIVPGWGLAELTVRRLSGSDAPLAFTRVEVAPKLAQLLVDSAPNAQLVRDLGLSVSRGDAQAIRDMVLLLALHFDGEYGHAWEEAAGVLCREMDATRERQLQESRRAAELLRQTQDDGTRREHELLDSLATETARRERAEDGVRKLISGLEATTQGRLWQLLAAARRTRYRGEQSHPLAALASAVKAGLPDDLQSPNGHLSFPEEGPQGPALAGTLSRPDMRLYVQLSPITFDHPLFQRPQHMAVAGARIGWDSRFQTPPGGEVADHRVLNREAARGLRVIGAEAARAAGNRGCVYSFLSTDLTIGWSTLQGLRRAGNVLIYEYIDEIDPAISPFARDLQRRHEELISPDSVDFVVASAKNLYEELAVRFPAERLLMVPNGVDTTFYWAARNSVADLDAYQRAGGRVADDRPVVGYFGAIAPWLDYPLIRAVALALPDFEFAFVGPDYSGMEGAGRYVAQLPLDLPNVRWLGKVDYLNLPRFARNFDVAWIPFEKGRIAWTTSPLKLFEYFALGLPTVAPRWMPECVQYPEVFSGDDAESLAKSIAMAAQLQDRDRLFELARANDWRERARVIDHALVSAGYWPEVDQSS